MSIDKKISGLLKEDPDRIDNQINSHSQDARPFGFIGTTLSKVIIGAPLDFHSDIGNRSDFIYPGRIWTKSKVISFWQYPEDRHEFDTAINTLNDSLKKINVKIDSSWKIDVEDDDGNPELVDIDDYMSDGNKIKDYDMGKEHIKSPMEKKKDTSKNSGKGVILPKGMTLAQYNDIRKKRLGESSP